MITAFERNFEFQTQSLTRKTAEEAFEIREADFRLDYAVDQTSLWR
jgi:hypothetical protein